MERKLNFGDSEPTASPTYSYLLQVSQVVSGVSYQNYTDNADLFYTVFSDTIGDSLNWAIAASDVSIIDVTSISSSPRESDSSTAINVDYSINTKPVSGYDDTIDAQTALANELIEAIDSGTFTSELQEKAKKDDAYFMADAYSTSVTIMATPTLSPTGSSVVTLSPSIAPTVSANSPTVSPTYTPIPTTQSPTVESSPTHKPTHSPTLTGEVDNILMVVGVAIGTVVILCIVLTLVWNFIWSSSKVEHTPLEHGHTETTSLLGRKKKTTVFGTFRAKTGDRTPNFGVDSVLFEPEAPPPPDADDEGSASAETPKQRPETKESK